LGQRGTVAHPLDSGALSLVGNALAGERTRGGAATLLRVAMDGHAALWILFGCGTGEEEEGQEKKAERKE
jgi:hypothetical protein